MVKHWQALLIFEILKYTYVSPENFLTLPPVDNISGKKFYDLVKILLNVGQNMTKPPPNVDRVLKHVGRQHDDDDNQYNESMKRNK